MTRLRRSRPINAARILREGGPISRNSSPCLPARRCAATFTRRAEYPGTDVSRTVTQFEQDKKAATELLSIGELPKPKNANEPLLAAWTGVANVLLNLNETIPSSL